MSIPQKSYDKLISMDKEIDDKINGNVDDNDEEFDINKYEIPEDEKEYNHYVEMLNIYNVYYKLLFKKGSNCTLFDEIDMDIASSTNRALEKLYEEIYKYKKAQDSKQDLYIRLFDPEEYKRNYLIDKLPEDYPFYMININDIQKVTHNLVSALNYIASFDWQNINWSINQINEF